MRRIIVCPQAKGGIGRSFVAALLFDFLCDQGAAPKVFDLGATLQRLVPEAEFIPPDDPVPLDRIVHGLDEADGVLVDRSGFAGSRLFDDLTEERQVDLQVRFGCEFVFLPVATDDKEANSEIADALDGFGGRVRWLVARNRREGARLDGFDRSRSRARLAALGAVEITVPHLAGVTHRRLQAGDLTVGRGRTAAKLHLLDRSRCARYRAHMAGEFGKAREYLAA